MKKLNERFNRLSAKRQKYLLMLFIGIFLILLVLSFYLPFYWNAGRIIQPSLTLKK